jgi:hypothetical protein
VKTCTACHTPKPSKRFRLRLCVCMDCENEKRKAYYRANRDVCIARSVRANTAWRKRVTAHRLKTRQWNRTAYRHRALGRSAITGNH